MRCTQANIIDALLKSVSETAQFLRQEDTSGQVGSSNTFGDKQLKVPPDKAYLEKFLSISHGKVICSIVVERWCHSSLLTRVASCRLMSRLMM